MGCPREKERGKLGLKVSVNGIWCRLERMDNGIITIMGSQRFKERGRLGQDASGFMKASYFWQSYRKKVKVREIQ